MPNLAGLQFLQAKGRKAPAYNLPASHAGSVQQASHWACCHAMSIRAHCLLALQQEMYTGVGKKQTNHSESGLKTLDPLIGSQQGVSKFLVIHMVTTLQLTKGN
jgi:hypothetical protein